MNNPTEFSTALNEYLAQLPPCPDKPPGRGIVTCAGGDVYQANAYVMFRLLRQLGCELPIECWYDGRTERDPVWERIAGAWGVRLVDACERGFNGFPYGTTARYRDKWHYPPAAVNGYALKCFALAHTTFRDVLFMDADNLPASDPTSLIESPIFQQEGNLFWRDVPNGQHGPLLAGFGLAAEVGDGLESGQLLIDTVRSWPVLCVANWLQQQADYTYRFSWGDKDLFLAAFLLLGREPTLAPAGRSAYENRAIIQPNLANEPLFFHRAGASKLRPHGSNQTIHEFPWNAESIRYLADWRQQKRLLSVSKSRAQLEADCVRAAVVTRLDEGVSACRVRTDMTMLVRNCDQSLASSLKTDGYWESFYTLACRRLIQPGWHCVDVGANYGYYATLFAQLVGRSGRVMALEPNAVIYPLLLETLRINALDCPLEILPIAAADQPGEMPLWTAEDNSGNASFIRHIAAHGATPQVVAVDTLDRLLAPWHRVDLIKIDAEGAEELIWAGMEQTLARGCRVMMEVQMSRYADPHAFWRRIKERFPLPCFLDYDGLVKPVPEYQLFEGAHHDWMLWLTPSRETSTL